eukprot:CAMPEP_0115707966 /NCGR_PEP_ID=MMETSP0272-20121206/71649_1 /TAXON_ID=71861 /ORGANISM="Scrippsiella trochoidea, Strain CCMP3099" /LENGTH=45 /DNA_ID= /DNA_START= /DNA_END= /DNA_ORIENTATION=
MARGRKRAKMRKMSARHGQGAAGDASFQSADGPSPCNISEILEIR